MRETTKGAADPRHRDRQGRWLRVGAVAEVTVDAFYPIRFRRGERFRVAKVGEDGGAVAVADRAHTHHSPGTFKIVSPPSKAESREIAKGDHSART